MPDISTNNYLNSLSLDTRQQQESAANEADAGSNELGQSAFLQLMITQLENQDPLSPQDNSEFVAQLAQFSSVEGIDRLNNSFDDFSSNFISNQALQASSLVGTSVSVPSTEAQLFEGGFVGGTINVPASTSDMTMNIYSQEGDLLEQIPMGSQSGGNLVFRWDGNRLEVDGKLTEWRSEDPITNGDFRFEVLATQDGEPQQLDTALTANVNSVTVDSNNQLVLNLAGIGPVSINDIKQFN
ncbi:MAG: flagellar basal-body rod modification protein FlgD [Cellvibrionaceae bacterium]|jgi:flagellar basal-body rod modification protein FlgD